MHLWEFWVWHIVCFKRIPKFKHWSALSFNISDSKSYWLCIYLSDIHLNPCIYSFESMYMLPHLRMNKIPSQENIYLDFFFLLIVMMNYTMSSTLPWHITFITLNVGLQDLKVRGAGYSCAQGFSNWEATGPYRD